MRKRRLIAVVVALAILVLLAWTVRETTSTRSAETSDEPPNPTAFARRDVAVAKPAPRRARAVVAPKTETSDAKPPRGETAAAIDGTPVPPARTSSDTKPAREAPGLVVDATTQRPVVGARVLLAILDGPLAGSWYGDETREDGRFRPHAEDPRVAAAHCELRIFKDGYETLRVPLSDGETRVELRPRTTPVLPGRVVGFARGPDGKPIGGEIAVEGFDEQGANATQRVRADAAGAFVLDGVPPGAWRFRISGGAYAETLVPEDGEARVEVVAAAENAKSSFVVTDVTIRPDTLHSGDPATEERLSTLRASLAAVDADKSLDAAAREAKSHELGQAYQRAFWDALRQGVSREVVVTGLPTEVRGWLRLANPSTPRDFLRVEVAAGVARFPSVAIGDQVATLVVPGSPERSWSFVVPTGRGAFETSLPR